MVTKQELGQLYYLNREIEQDKQHLAELEAAATSMSYCISGLPHAAGVADKTALAAEIADLRAIIQAKSLQSIAQYNRIMRFVSGLEDCQLRMIITYRCANGLTWQQVANHVGGGNTSDAMRKRFNAFFKQ